MCPIKVYGCLQRSVKDGNQTTSLGAAIRSNVAFLVSPPRADLHAYFILSLSMCVSVWKSSLITSLFPGYNEAMVSGF